MRVAIIADEVGQDMSEALDHIVSWGLDCIELRTAWGTNLVDLEEREVDRLVQLVRSRGLTVAAIASPVLKCWLDNSRRLAPGDAFFSRERNYTEHLALLDRAIDLAHRFGTSLVRCFAFWREEDGPAAWPQIVNRFEEPVKRAERGGVTLVLENESSTNVGTGAEIARLVNEVRSPHLAGLWDPGNAMYAGEVPYPSGYHAVRQFIAHVHIKDVKRTAKARGLETVPPGRGDVDFEGQLRALKADGYAGVLSLEPHYHPQGLTSAQSAEECVRALQKLLRDNSL
jgi:sugar phosphate isomerase/epimerase